MKRGGSGRNCCGSTRITQWSTAARCCHTKIPPILSLSSTASAKSVWPSSAGVLPCLSPRQTWPGAGVGLLRRRLRLGSCRGPKFLPRLATERGLNRDEENRHHQQRQGHDGRHPSHHARAQPPLV